MKNHHKMIMINTMISVNRTNLMPIAWKLMRYICVLGSFEFRSSKAILTDMFYCVCKDDQVINFIKHHSEFKSISVTFANQTTPFKNFEFTVFGGVPAQGCIMSPADAAPITRIIYLIQVSVHYNDSMLMLLSKWRNSEWPKRKHEISGVFWVSTVPVLDIYPLRFPEHNNQ